MNLKSINHFGNILYGVDIEHFITSQNDITSIIYFTNKTNISNLIDNNKVIIVSPLNTDLKGVHFTRINNNILKYITSNSLIAIDLDDSTSFNYMCFLIKNLIHLFKILKKHKITLNYTSNNSVIVALLSFDNKLKYFDDICTTFMALFATSKKEQYEIIYDAVCNYLDNEFIGKNLCGFCNDVCNASRQGLTHFEKNGCCYTFDYFRSDS